MAAEATYCRVLPSFWTDPKVKRRLSREQKHLLLYFFTSPHTNLIGLYYLPLTYAEAEAEIPRADIEAWLAGPLTPFVTYDADTEEILVHRAARHQIGEELKPKDNRRWAVERILRDTHSLGLAARFRSLYPTWPLDAPAMPREHAGPVPTGPKMEGLPGPSVSPLVSPHETSGDPLVSLSSSSSSTDAKHKELPLPLLPPRAGIDESIETKIDSIVLAANAGMARNTTIGKRFEPIPPGHSSRQDVREWLDAGVPPDVVLEVVEERASTFQPEGRRRQIHSMKYFTPAVLDEHDRRKALESANGDSKRSGRPAGSRGSATEMARASNQAARRQRGFGT